MNEQHEALGKFSEQIRYALEQYKPHGLNISSFSNMIIAGLGGSGIGGRITSGFFVNDFPVPIECISDYTLPGYVNDRTLAVLCSYSGNTEETVGNYHEAKKRGCKLLVLSSGGELKRLAEADNVPVYTLQTGFQPRMALGFSIGYLTLLLGELAGKDMKAGLEEAAEAVSNVKVYQDEATAIFEKIKNRTRSKLVVLTDGPMYAVGMRFAQQINENAKHECFCHALPEMNHNVIESYYGKLDTLFFFLDSMQHERITSRFEFLSNLLEVENNKVIHVPMEEFNVRSVAEVIYVLDWLSLYIADQRGVDSLNVPNIASLKEFLAEVH
jgi:glucose/mannose-6-phosphate isomerase